MKITEDFIISHYTSLKQKAYYILKGIFELPSTKIEMLAEDVTTKFFYSNSLRDNYSPLKGEVQPFFSSYVRKSAQRLRETMRKHYAVPFEPWMAESYVPTLAYDFTNLLSSFIQCLHGKALMSRGKKISYGKLFKSTVIQILNGDMWGDNINCTLLAKDLGATKSDVSYALAKMRETLNEKRSRGVI